MSSAAGDSSGMRWPDVAVGAGCVLLIAVLAWVVLGSGPRKSDMSTDVVVAYQLRNINVALIIYGLDNRDYLPGLNPDGSLLTNDPAERYDLLTASEYLAPDLLVSPADARPDAKHSYAILDLSQPGARRDAWTTLESPDGPILAESPISLGQASAWSGWVLWHRNHFETHQGPAVERLDSARLRTRYLAEGPFNDDDDLFTADGLDDAYLISADR